MTTHNQPNPTSIASVKQPHRSIRPANPTDLAYLIKLQKQWSNAVGFLPRAAFVRYIDEHRILCVFENGQHAGYLTWALRRDGMLHIPQVAIEAELLRTTLGTRLMHRIEKAAIAGSCSVLRLRSRSDLSANTFWPTVGFSLTATIARPTTRGLPLLEWTKNLLRSQDLATIFQNNGRPTRLYRRRPVPHVVHDHLECTDA